MKLTRQEVLLSIIATAMCAIAVKLIFFGPPTFDDFRALAEIQNTEARNAKFTSLAARTPVIWIRGGNVDVSGSVEIER